MIRRILGHYAWLAADWLLAYSDRAVCEFANVTSESDDD